MLKNRIPLISEYTRTEIPARSEARILEDYDGGHLIEFSHLPGVFRLPYNELHLFDHIPDPAHTQPPSLDIDDVISEVIGDTPSPL